MGGKASKFHKQQNYQTLFQSLVGLETTLTTLTTACNNGKMVHKWQKLDGFMVVDRSI